MLVDIVGDTAGRARLYRDVRSVLRPVPLLVLAACAAHLAFAAVDTRPPQDPGQFYWAVWGFAHQMRRPWGILASLPAMAEPGIWLQWVIALPQAVAGPSAWLYHLVQAGFLALVLVATARLARDTREQVAAVALTAAMPLVTEYARFGWIHVPEAALLLLALGVLQRDPELGRGRVALASFGALAILLRPTGLVFLAPVALLHLRTRRALPVLATWALATVPVLVKLVPYLQIKVDARARYAATLDPLWIAVPRLLGPLVVALLVVGIARRSQRPLAGVERVLALWVAMALGLEVVFRSGLFNFTVVGAALALLAAPGLARSLAPTAAAVAVAVGVWVVPFAPVVPGWYRARPADIRSWHRPWRGYGSADALALLDSACPPGRRCDIAVDEGLVVPFVETRGEFDVEILGRRDVSIRDVRAWSGQASPPAAALVAWDCPELESTLRWSERNPGSDTATERVIERFGMEPVYREEVGPDCAVVWLAPGGAFPANRPSGPTRRGDARGKPE